MRELDECTAEVFRRSEKRIKERRRNHSRILAVCIPVCLIVTVWSAIIFPGMMPTADTSDLAQAVEEINGKAEGSLAGPYVSVEIQTAGPLPEGHDREVTDRLAVAEMFRAIQSLFADTDGNDLTDGGNVPAEEEPAANDLTDAASNRTDCTITFTAEDGSRAVYRLSGNELANERTNETIFLSDPQMAKLLAVLNISE